jgi:hypothetical protein
MNSRTSRREWWRAALQGGSVFFIALSMQVLMIEEGPTYSARGRVR